MAKLSLTDIANLQNENSVVAAVNSNNTAIEAAIENTLSRDGTSPNTMNAALDMNSYHIYNLPAPVAENSPLRLQDLFDFQGGSFAAETANSILTKLLTVDGTGSGLDADKVDGQHASAFAASSHTHTVGDITGATLLTTSSSSFPSAATKTANYTVISTDFMRTIQLNGTFTLSLTAAATLGSSFWFRVANIGTRRVTIDPNGAELIDGAATLYIYPGQGFHIYCDGNAFYTVGRPTRWVTSSPIIYIATTGSDSNDGLVIGSPMLTIQTAVDFVLSNIDSGTTTSTVQLADGTYDQRFQVIRDGLGSNQIAVLGNSSTPTNCVLAPSSGGDAIVYVKDKGICTLTGVYLHSTAAAAAVSAEQMSVIDLNNVVFGPMGTGTHMSASNGFAQINVNTNYRVTGDAGTHMAAQFGGRITINNATVTVDAGLTFTYWALAQFVGNIQISNSHYSATMTGTKHLVQLNGVIGLGGVTTTIGGSPVAGFPGNTAGSTATGGQIA